jgi:predicted nucleic acid-binding protein
VLSTQVLLELNANLTGKFKLNRHTAAMMTAAYADWTVIESDLALVLRAIARSTEQNHSIWDAMIIEAAIRAGASTLYSEDMQHGRRFGGLLMVNPFLTP